MKTFMTYLEQKEVKWIKPSIEEESGEFERVAKDLDMNVAALMGAARKGKLVDLSDKVWKSMENTDSWHNIKPGDFETVESLARGYGRDVERIKSAYVSGGTLPAPIVVSFDNRNTLLGGNTRLMIARAMGIRPKILLVSL